MHMEFVGSIHPPMLKSAPPAPYPLPQEDKELYTYRGILNSQNLNI